MFWIHVFKAYREFGKHMQVENSEELVADPIFCNDNILVETKLFFLKKKKEKKKWIDKGVCFIKNILMKMVRLCYLKSLKKYTELILITLHILDVYKLLKATYVKRD